MEYIKSRLDNIKSQTGITSLGVIIQNEDLLSNFDIVLKMLKAFNGRLIDSLKEGVDIEIGEKDKTYFAGRISEYPKCCGVVILSSLYLTNYLPNDEAYCGFRSLLAKDASVIVDEGINIISHLCKLMGYSSLEFIVSKEEQESLYSNISLKPVYSFTNFRMLRTHTCDKYVIDLNKFGELLKI